ncbi:MAG: hypothetical protein FWD82_10625, partial [Defluviitaleaceae bacterium]|nr:hypothetical protein [Defluviitaleaceae bacterium]
STEELIDEFSLDELEDFIEKLYQAKNGRLKHSTSIITKRYIEHAEKVIHRFECLKFLHPEYENKKNAEEQKMVDAMELSKKWDAEGLCWICGNKLGGLLKKTCKANKFHTSYNKDYNKSRNFASDFHHRVLDRDKTWLRKAEREELHKASVEELASRFKSLAELEFYIERISSAVTGDLATVIDETYFINKGKEALAKLNEVKKQHPESSR